MTLLEVVLAVVLLGLISAAVTGTITFSARMDARADERLSAYEIANRIVLQYLDQRTALPDRNLPLQYGRFKFFWECVDEKFEMKIKPPDTSGAARAAPRELDRFERIEVRVWRADDPTGNGIDLRRGEELAHLVRVLDPVAFRNPDAAVRMATPEGIQDMMQRLGGLQRSGDLGIAPAPPSGSTPRGSGNRATPNATDRGRTPSTGRTRDRNR
jgi:hypothetical protein